MYHFHSNFLIIALMWLVNIYLVNCQGFGAIENPTIAKLCQENANAAHTYCVGPPNEIPLAKARCDQWRQYCQPYDSPNAAPSSSQFIGNTPPCAPHEVQYLTLCVQQQPVTDEISAFCYAYRHSCLFGRKPSTLNTGFNAPVGRPLDPGQFAASRSSIVDPYPAPWSSIYTFDQGKATLFQNGPLPALPNLPPPWSSPPNKVGQAGTGLEVPIGAIPPNPALQSGAPQFATGAGAAPAPAVAPSGSNIIPNPLVPPGLAANTGGFPLGTSGGKGFTGPNVGGSGGIQAFGKRRRRSVLAMLMQGMHIIN